MFDIDKFIQCVQDNPAIWEKGNVAYSDRNLREKAWIIIGKNMFDTWMAITDYARQEKVNEMKNKWRHIRDSFRKYINHGENGDAAKKKKYVYADALTFLLQTFDKRKTPRNATKAVEKNDVKLLHQEADETSQISGSVETVYHQRVSSPEAAVSSKRPNEIQKKILEKLDNQNTEVEEADIYFLLSLLPDLKKLNHEQKLDFRFHTLQFFRDIRLKPVTPPSQHLQGVHSQYQPNTYNIANIPPLVPSPCRSPGSPQQSRSPFPASPQESTGSNNSGSAYSENTIFDV